MKIDQDLGCGGPGGHVGSILLVEDEFLIRLAAADDLREAGYQVVEAASGAEARDVLLSGAGVDLVISDVRMPGEIDGLGLLAFVRSNFPNLSVYLCSAHLTAGAARAQGAAGFLAKPYTGGELADMIRAS